MAMNQQDQFSPTVYGGFTLYNPTSKVDKTALSFSMWKSVIRISIIPVIETESINDIPRYDFKNSISIFLTPIKAHLFAQILEKFKVEPDRYNNYGITTPQSIISISRVTGSDNKGISNPVVSIRKVNEEGNVEMSYSYECNNDSFTSIVGFNVNKPKDFKQDTEIFRTAEIDAIIMQLETYYQAMTNATAFSVLNTMYPYLDRLSTKLGVDLSGNNNPRKGNGFFTNSGTGFNNNNNMNTQQQQRYLGNTTDQSSNPKPIHYTSQQQTYDASQLRSLVEDN